MVWKIVADTFLGSICGYFIEAYVENLIYKVLVMVVFVGYVTVSDAILCRLL